MRARAVAAGAAVVAGVVVLTAALGGCRAASPGPSAGASDPSASPRAVPHDDGWIAADDDDALFTVDCGFARRASDDPIVHPGHPGASHSHDFFGSTAADASSTGPALRGTSTTCDDTDDTAAYWVPTLSVDGAPVDPTYVRAYYRAAPGTDVRQVEPLPLGLAMLAPAAPGGHGEHGAGAVTGERGGTGSHAGHGRHRPPSAPEGASGAAAEAASPASTGWGCGLRPRRLRASPPTDCTDRSPLTLRLLFPDCWDGERLDSHDHRSHLAPSVAGTCPPTHPVLLTQVQLSVVWPVTGPAAGRAVLSSGSTAEPHGDLLNGWDPDALARHVELCIHAKANCTIG